MSAISLFTTPTPENITQLQESLSAAMVQRIRAIVQKSQIGLARGDQSGIQYPTNIATLPGVEALRASGFLISGRAPERFFRSIVVPIQSYRKMFAWC